jgi:hypothetical protein
MRIQCLSQTYGIPAIAALTCHLKRRLAGKDRPQALAHNSMIVSE